MNSEKYQYKCQPVDLNLINEYMFHNKWKRASCLLGHPVSKPGAHVFPLKEWEWGEKLLFRKKKMFRNKKSN